MKREMKYRVKSFHELIEDYAYECGRNNREDEITKKLKIVNEVYARVKEMFDGIEEVPTTWENAYRQFLREDENGR